MHQFDENQSLPNIASLITLADFLNYPLSELISDHIRIDINKYMTIDDYILNKNGVLININVPFIDNCLNQPKKFAIVKNKDKYTENLEIFLQINSVEYDGKYIAEVNDRIELLKVISVSSTRLNVEHGKNIENIPIDSVKFMAKYIADAVLIQDKRFLIAYKT